MINNNMLIYNNNKIIYQKYNPSVRLDAIDIVKTVKIKGKNRDISQHVNFTANPGEFIAFVDYSLIFVIKGKILLKVNILPGSTLLLFAISYSIDDISLRAKL